MFFLETKTIPGSFSFCCMIAFEYTLSFSKLLKGAKLTPSFHSKKENEISIDDIQMSVAYMKENSMMVLMKKFHLKKRMFW